MPKTLQVPRLQFAPLRLEDREAVQAVTLQAGRRNCNLTFANLFGWQFLFDTELCLLPDILVVRYHFGHQRQAYLVSSGAPLQRPLVEALRIEAARMGNELMLIAVEDDWAAQIAVWYPEAQVYAMRDSYDYIYLREDLERLYGKGLKAKRNHVNKFLADHPDYRYCSLEPAHFDTCRQLAALWRTAINHENPWYGNTIESEYLMMERIFSHWDALDMMGGCIFVGDCMVAFSFGAPVTANTFDTMMEKADRSVDGAFNIINQQLVVHLPSQFRYINREEDMGLQGLRQSKSSYHPHALLSYNRIIIPCL